MRASVLVDVGRLELRELVAPRVRRHDVLLRVTAVGLCGTDFHIFAGHANYWLDARGKPVPLSRHPQVLGHEIVGVIEGTGQGVADVARGQRVVVDQGVNCVSEHRVTRCEYCASGDSHQCEAYREHGISGLPGGLAGYLAVPAVNVVTIDSDLDDAEAALTEPLACVLHAASVTERAAARYALRTTEPARAVRSVFLSGAGPAGLLFLQYLRSVIGFDGLAIVSEPSAHKRGLARALGAQAIDPASDDPVAVTRELTAGRRVEMLVDASGAAELFAEIPGLIRKQATVLLYGHGRAGASLEMLNPVQWLEPTLIATVGASGGFDPDLRPSVYRRALGLIAAGTIRVRDLVTHRYRGLEQVPLAFSGEHRARDYVKGVVLMA
ncbi:MAG: alcohol dehydrogenase catalytic domain-containing protein [Planctomycetota bacterium]